MMISVSLKSVLRLGILLALVTGCETSPQSADERSDASEAMLEKQLAGINLFAAHPSAIVRGNVMMASSIMRQGRWKDIANPCFLIGAMYAKFSARPEWPEGLYAAIVDAVGTGPAADQFVFLFRTPSGDLAELRYPNLWADAGPVSLGFDTVCFRARYAPIDELCAKGQMIEGRLVIDDPADYKNTPPHVALLPGPDVKLTLGLHYPNGTYSNFVPFVLYMPPEDEEPAKAGGRVEDEE